MIKTQQDLNEYFKKATHNPQFLRFKGEEIICPKCNKPANVKACFTDGSMLIYHIKCEYCDIRSGEWYSLKYFKTVANAWLKGNYHKKHENSLQKHYCKFCGKEITNFSRSTKHFCNVKEAKRYAYINSDKYTTTDGRCKKGVIRNATKIRLYHLGEWTVYNSVKEASQALGVSKTTLFNRLKDTPNKRRKTYNFIVERVEEVSQNCL